ncbi:MAG: molybdenum cofactor guanylyltransferase [Verrucomicrobiota bacterium]
MTLTAALLVGGLSRRMGVDKATLPCGDGMPLWRRQWALFDALKPAARIISGREKPCWCPPEIEVVCDESPSRGPLSGLHALFKSASTTHLLVLAVDLPCMTADHLVWLRDHVTPACGVMPWVNGGLEPLCAIYPATRAVAEMAARQLAGENFSLRTFAGGLISQGLLRKVSVPSGEWRLYQNTNTPGEFAAAVRSAGSLL